MTYPTPDRFRACYLLFLAALLLLSGCWSASSEELVLYVALDSEFSQPILEQFEQQSGLKTAARFDVESTKTVGLTEAIIAERDRPRCDVFWNNEILNTLRLEDLGVLDNYQSPLAENYPPMYRDAEGAWHGLAARAPGARAAHRMPIGRARARREARGGRAVVGS